jgi:hypothetical protein
MHDNDIGDVKERTASRDGLVELVTMSDEEALLFIIRWGDLSE